MALSQATLGALGTSYGYLRAVVRILAHDQDHGASLQAADVSPLASAALAALTVASISPSLAGGLCGMLAKALQPGVSGSTAAVLEQYGLQDGAVLQALLELLAKNMHALCNKGRGHGMDLTFGQELMGRLLEMVGLFAAPAKQEGAAVGKGEGLGGEGSRAVSSPSDSGATNSSRSSSGGASGSLEGDHMLRTVAGGAAGCRPESLAANGGHTSQLIWEEGGGALEATPAAAALGRGRAAGTARRDGGGPATGARAAGGGWCGANTPLVHRLHKLLALNAAVCGVRSASGLGSGFNPRSVVESIVQNHNTVTTAAAGDVGAGLYSSTFAPVLQLSKAVDMQTRCAELELALQHREQREKQLEQEAQELRADQEHLQQELQQLKMEQQLKQQQQEQQRLLDNQQNGVAHMQSSLPPGPPPPTAGPAAAVQAHPAPQENASPVAACRAPAVAAVAESWDESSDPLLAVEVPGEVHPEAAKEFVMKLRGAREGCRQMRKAFCSMLKHLSTRLYSSSEHLMHELIQNAEDAHVASQGKIGEPRCSTQGLTGQGCGKGSFGRLAVVPLRIIAYVVCQGTT